MSTMKIYKIELKSKEDYRAICTLKFKFYDCRIWPEPDLPAHLQIAENLLRSSAHKARNFLFAYTLQCYPFLLFF